MAIGIPAILGVIGLGLGVLRWGMDGVSATAVASETAFAIARGEDLDALVARSRAAMPDVVWEATTESGRVCVIASIPAPLALVSPHEVRQCASM